MSNTLDPTICYHFGDFLIKPNKNGSIKIYCDKGVLSIIPRANNLIKIKSIQQDESDID